MTTDLTALAARVEAVTANEQRQMLLEAFEAVHRTPAKRNRGGDNAANRFIAMLDAKAYESAAMTLVPSVRCGFKKMDDGKTMAWAWSEQTIRGLSINTQRNATAATPALALTAAALRAQVTQ